MRAELEASTVTPGSTAPESSTTVPVICACANATDGTRTNSARSWINGTRVRAWDTDTRTTEANLHIAAPPECRGDLPLFGNAHGRDDVTGCRYFASRPPVMPSTW